MSTHRTSPRYPAVLGRRRTSRAPQALLAALAAGAAVTLLASCAGVSDPQAFVADDPAPVTYGFTGQTQQYTVPSGVTRVTITAAGGAGGQPRVGGHRIGGALITGTLPVQPGQQLLVSVGQSGGDAGSTDDDPQGGWGGLGAHGGNGNAAKDTLRTSGGGGGATTVQLAGPDGSNPQVVLIAGGAGGNGGTSGDPDSWGSGGSAGCRYAKNGNQKTASWIGADGDSGSLIDGGGGGRAAGQPGMAGARGKGGSGLGGNGGGGGGGGAGGNPGGGAGGTSAAGGGGAGSSITAQMTDTIITCYVDDNEYGKTDTFVTVSPADV